MRECSPYGFYCDTVVGESRRHFKGVYRDIIVQESKWCQGFAYFTGTHTGALMTLSIENVTGTQSYTSSCDLKAMGLVCVCVCVCVWIVKSACTLCADPVAGQRGCGGGGAGQKATNKLGGKLLSAARVNGADDPASRDPTVDAPNSTSFPLRPPPLTVLPIPHLCATVRFTTQRYAVQFTTQRYAVQFTTQRYAVQFTTQRYAVQFTTQRYAVQFTTQRYAVNSGYFREVPLHISNAVGPLT